MSSSNDDADVEISAKFLKLFQKFNPINIWSSVSSVDDFTLTRMSAGAVGEVFCCELNLKNITTRQPNVDDITKIVVKYMPDDFGVDLKPLDTCITHTIICNSGLGPKLIYVDNIYKVFECIEGRNYSYQDDCDESVVKILARMLAKFHNLKVPISGDAAREWQDLCSNFEQSPFFEPILNKTYWDVLENYPIWKQKYSEIILKMDMPKEMKDVLSWIESVNQSTLVFCHCDFNRQNRLIEVHTNRIYLIDFDFSNYSNRGQDLGRYFSNYRHHDDMFGAEGFPSDEEMVLFLEEYRQEYARLLGGNQEYLQDPRNSLKQLIRETKIYTLFAYTIDVTFGLSQFAEMPDGAKAEYYLNVAKTRWIGLQELKHRFINVDKILEEF